MLKGSFVSDSPAIWLTSLAALTSVSFQPAKARRVARRAMTPRVVVVQTVSRPRHAVAQVSDWWCNGCVDQAWTSKQVCVGPVMASFTVKSRLARQRLLPLYTLMDWRECTSHR